jgi:hypothetical protein
MPLAVFSAVISLGTTCQTAYQTRRRFGFETAYPFDWLVIPPETVALVVRQGFEVPLVKQRLIRRRGFIFDPQLGIKMPHDFPIQDDWMDAYDDVSSKYRFLAERTRDAANAGQVLFVLHDANPEGVSLVREALSAYPGWSLLVANTPDVPLPEGQPVVTALLDGEPPELAAWRGNERNWEEAFDKAVSEVARRGPTSAWIEQFA